MLEKIPASVGRALRQVRAGQDKLVSDIPEFEAASESIALTSSAFEDGEPMPARYTADGDKISPPLAWRNIPQGARSLVLIIQDPDAPAPQPLVHLLAFDLPPDLAEAPEGLFKSPRDEGLEEDSAATPTTRRPTCRPIRPRVTAFTSTPSSFSP